VLETSIKYKNIAIKVNLSALINLRLINIFNRTQRITQQYIKINL